MHRDDGKRFVVQADEKLTAFVELESAIRVVANCLDKLAGFFPDSTSLNGFRIRRRTFRPRFFVFSGPATFRLTAAGTKKGKPYESIDSTKKNNSCNSRRSGLLRAFADGASSPTAATPDGGYLNQNTAEGDNALFSLTTGGFNTAIGFQALHNNTTGGFNTASGRSALHNNTTGDGNTASGSQALDSIQLAAPTRPLVFKRFYSTQAAPTRLPAKRAPGQYRGSANTASVLKRSRATQPAFKTRPSVPKRSIIT